MMGCKDGGITEAAPGVNIDSDDDADGDDELIVAWPARVVKVRTENGRWRLVACVAIRV
jgi:hypothetical protein